MIGVESAVSGFTSFRECGGLIIGAGRSTLPSSMVEKIFPPKIVWCNI